MQYPNFIKKIQILCPFNVLTVVTNFNQLPGKMNKIIHFTDLTQNFQKVNQVNFESLQKLKVAAMFHFLLLEKLRLHIVKLINLSEGYYDKIKIIFFPDTFNKICFFFQVKDHKQIILNMRHVMGLDKPKVKQLLYCIHNYSSHV